MAKPGRPKTQRLDEDTEDWLFGEYQRLLKDPKATIANQKALLDSMGSVDHHHGPR